MSDYLKNKSLEHSGVSEFDMEDERIRALENIRYARALNSFELGNTDPIVGFRGAAQLFFEKYENELRSKPNAEILDVGCGIGKNAITLAKNSFTIKGVDISEVAIDFANRLAQKNDVKVEFKQGGIRKLPYTDQSFDAVLGVGIYMGHSKDYLKEAFKEADRVLKPGGILFFNGNLIDQEQIIQQTKALGLIRYFDKNMVGELISGTNFEVEDLTYSERDKDKINIKVSCVSLRKK